MTIALPEHLRQALLDLLEARWQRGSVEGVA